MSTLKLLLVGLGSRLTIMFIGMVNTILLARWLGPANVGEYFLLIRLVTVLTIFADFGLRQSANVFTGRHEEWTSHIHNILLRFTLVSWIGVSLVGAAVVFLAKDFLLHDFPRKWIWIAFGILALSLYANLWNGMMVGRGRIWQLNLVQLVTNAATLVFTVVFIVGLSGGVLAAVMIYCVTTTIQVVIMIIMAHRMSSRSDEGQIPADLPRQMLSFGLRGYPGAISSLLWVNASVFILNAFHGMTAVGIFSVAQQFVEKLLLPIQAMQEAIFKKISALPSRAATLAMNRYVRLTSWVMVLATLLGVTLMPWIVHFLLGDAYVRAAQICRLLLPGTAAISVPMLLTVYFLSQLRRPGLLSILGLANALLTLILSLLFIPKLAEIGAASAIVISQVLGTVVVLALYLRFTQTRFKELIAVDTRDFTIIRRQIGAILGRKGAADE